MTFLSAFILISSIAFNETNKVDTHVINGAITLQTTEILKVKTRTSPNLSLVFENSPGSDGFAGLILEDFKTKFEQKKIKTYARGYCLSTCSFAFLMGEHPTLLPPTSWMSPTYLLVHPIMKASNYEILRDKTDQILQQIVAKSQNKISIEFLNHIYVTKNLKGGIYIFRKPITNSETKEKSYVQVCTGLETRIPFSCKSLPDVTPESLGISVE